MRTSEVLVMSAISGRPKTRHHMADDQLNLSIPLVESTNILIVGRYINIVPCQTRNTAELWCVILSSLVLNA